MKFDPKLEKWRIQEGQYASPPGVYYGAFDIPGPLNQRLAVIACDASPTQGVFWEHVSVSTKNRVPLWREMCFIKALFWGEDETVMQLHPPKSQYVNQHKYCLHLWRPTREKIPMPPLACV